LLTLLTSIEISSLPDVPFAPPYPVMLLIMDNSPDVYLYALHIFVYVKLLL
jgi:hypothetical protein